MLRHYAKTALKVFLRRKFFTGVSLFGITVTLAILGVVSSFLDHVCGAHPPETRADRTLFVFQAHYELRNEYRDDSQDELSIHFIDRYIRSLDRVERVGAAKLNIDEVTHYTSSGDQVDSWVKYTDAEFWNILSFEFREGRPYTAQEVADVSPVAVINESTRSEMFGDGPAVGQVLPLGTQRLRVVGVVADVSMVRVLPVADIWVPYTVSERLPAPALTGGVEDLKGGFTAIILARTPGDFSAIRHQLAERLAPLSFPEADMPVHSVRAYAESFFDLTSMHLFGQDSGTRYPGLLLGLIVGLMLLFMALPSLNLVNLSVSRVVERASEIGVRRAFGATRLSLLAQFLAENVLLTLIGGVGGLLGTLAILHVINAMELIPHTRFVLNLRVLGYGVLLAFALGLISGAYPAWKMSRLRPVQALRRGGR